MSYLDTLSKERLEEMLEQNWQFFRINSCGRWQEFVAKAGRDWRKERDAEYDVIVAIEKVLYEKFYKKQDNQAEEK